jgi:hypothetical protein
MLLKTAMDSGWIIANGRLVVATRGSIRDNGRKKDKGGWRTTTPLSRGKAGLAF